MPARWVIQNLSEKRRVVRRIGRVNSTINRSNDGCNKVSSPKHDRRLKAVHIALPTLLKKKRI